MSGNKTGGLKARDTILARDPDYYRRIGKLGGSATSDRPRGFAYLAGVDPAKLSEVSAKGGSKSRRRKRT